MVAEKAPTQLDNKMTSDADDFNTARRARNRLLPFLALMLVYFCLYNPFLHWPPQNLLAASFKAAPIWYLACYVGMARDFRHNGVAIGAMIELVLSSLGDMCLIWRHTLFLPGILCYALAQIAYLTGLRFWLKTYHYEEKKRDLILIGAFVLLFFFTYLDTWQMAASVLVYTAILDTMTHYARQRYLLEQSQGSMAGAYGAICFVFMDIFIAIPLVWKEPIPCSEALKMVAYYSAQSGIAFGAVMSRFAAVEERGKGDADGGKSKLE